MLRFSWSSIEEYEIEEESMSFNFLYSRDNKKPRWVKIMTSYVRIPFVYTSVLRIAFEIVFCDKAALVLLFQYVYLYECFDKLKSELKFEKEVTSFNYWIHTAQIHVCYFAFVISPAVKDF